MRSLRTYLIALVGLAASYVAGCDGNGNPNPNPINPIQSGYSASDNMTPANGTTVGAADSPLEVGVRTPALSPDCSADADCSAAAASGVNVDINATYDNATPGNAADDETVTVAAHTGVPFDTYTSGTLDMSAAHGGAGLADGEKINLEVIITATDAEGTAHEARGNATLTYEAGTTNQPPVVDWCNVTHSNEGSALAITCSAHDPEGADLYGRWNLTTDFPGVIITEEGLIGGVGGPSEVGLHNYSVTVSDGERTSAPYDFTVPYDTHRSDLLLHCNGGSDNRLLLPETSVDAVATSCGTGFNPSLKPGSSSEPDYVLDVNPACVSGAIAALPAAEREAHQHYNGGTTVDDVFSTCTVDFAQVIYSK